MLPSVLSPWVGVGMLVDRRYAPIWKQIKAWAGSDLSAQRLAVVDGARAAYRTSRAPDDLLSYTTALYEAGYSDQAIAELQVWLSATGTDAEPFYRNAAAIRLGNILGERRLRAQAIARMKAALDGPIGRDVSAGNIVPNFAIQMLLAQDYKGALALLDS